MKTMTNEAEPVGCDHHHTLTRDTLLRIARRDEQVDLDAAATLFALIDLGSALRRRFAAVLAEQGLSEAKFCALTVLHRLDPATMTAAEVAYHAGVSRSALTDIIDQMVAQQWVERERSPDDRRTVRIGLSGEGRARAETAIACVIQATAVLLRDCPEIAGPQLATFCRTMSERCSFAPLPVRAESGA